MVSGLPKPSELAIVGDLGAKVATLDKQIQAMLESTVKPQAASAGEPSKPVEGEKEEPKEEGFVLEPDGASEKDKEADEEAAKPAEKEEGKEDASSKV